MKFNCGLFILFFVSCNNQPSKNVAKKVTEIDSLKNTLVGEWGGLGENSPVWEINVESIYYYQENKSYPYEIIDKDLVIDRFESKGVLRNISVAKDTLTFYDEQGLKIKGYRFKTKK